MHIQLRNITKKFDHTTACAGINLELAPGKIHALLGDNGAGKSTLMKILAGVVKPDSGEIVINEKSYDSLSPSSARELKIAMVYQGFSLVEQLSVAENLQLGKPTNGNSLFAKVSKSDSTHLDVFADLDLTAQLGDLDMGERQQVEILKTLEPLPEVLILDEPTIFLNKDQIAELKTLLKDLSQKGCSIVFISHDLDEVLDIADFISVLENGEVVEEAEEASELKYKLSNVRQGLASSISEMDSLVLEIVDLAIGDESSSNPINLTVRPSEIVAFVGNEFEDETPDISLDLMPIFLGLNKNYSGEIYIKGNLLAPQIPGAVQDAGVAVIPKDREHSACIPKMSVAENLFLLQPITRKGFLDKNEMLAKAKDLMTEYGVVPNNPELKFSELSGGNQQRVLLARELSSNPKVLIIESLIEGLDIKAVDDICWNIQRAAARGVAVLMLAKDPDLIQMAHTKITLSKTNL